MKRHEAFTRIGKPQFRLERVVSPRLPFVAPTSCIRCGDSVLVEFGAIGAVFRCGTEFVGVCCDSCLDEPSRETLARLRAATGRMKVPQ